MTIFFSKSNDEHDGRQKEVGKDKKISQRKQKRISYRICYKKCFFNYINTSPGNSVGAL